MNIIILTDNNYQEFLNLDIVAFSFASPGAMGDGGGICIIDKAGKVYYANFCVEEKGIDLKHVEEVIPVLNKCRFGYFGEMAPLGWDSVYLGFGNHLVFVNEISEDFHQMIDDAKFEKRGELYQHWPGLVLTILNKADGELHIYDILDTVYRKTGDNH